MALLDQFVCVRMIQINDLDLSRHQFDFELTWAAFFLNGDGTVYGRYGTRSENDRKRNVKFARSDTRAERDGMPRDMSLSGLKAAMRAALALHRRYEGGEADELRAGLAGKIGEPWPWRTPSEIPGIRRSCTHCHQVPSNLVLHHRKQAGGVPDALLWSFPMPDALGFALDPREAATITRVDAGSEARGAGLRAGDRIRALGGQPVLSPADVQWVLQHATEGQPLPMEVTRAGAPRPVRTRIMVTKGWRRRAGFSWRWRSNRETLSRILDGEAWHCEDLSKEERRGLQLGADALAIRVVGNLGRGRGRRLSSGDVIIGVDGDTRLANTSEFFAYIMQRKQPGTQLELTVLRGDETQRVLVPVIR